MRSVECNLCGETDFKVVFRSFCYPDGREGDVLQCLNCKLVFRQQSTGNSTENPHPVPSKNCLSTIDANRLSVFEYYIRKLAGSRKVNRLLDIGSGDGTFLELAIEDGWGGIGIEVSTELAIASKKRIKLPVINAAFEDVRLPVEQFDVATLINVLEHLTAPGKSINKIYDVLRPGGKILIRFANSSFHVPIRQLFYQAQRRWNKAYRFDPTMISNYSLSCVTLTQYLSKAGFTAPIFENSFTFKWLNKYIKSDVTRNKNSKLLLAPSLTAFACKPL